MHLVQLVIATIAIFMKAINGETGSGILESFDSSTIKGIKSKPLRVVFLDKQYVTQNKVVISKMEQQNLSYVFANTCEKPATAIPEWYARTRE